MWRASEPCGVVDPRIASCDHNVDRSILDHVLSGAIRLDSRVVFLGIVLGLGCALHNSIEFELRNFCDEGNVEDFGTEAIAYDTDVPGFGGHDDCLDVENEPTEQSL